MSDFVSSNDDGSELPEEFEGAKDDQMHEADYMKFIQFGISSDRGEALTIPMHYG